MSIDWKVNGYEPADLDIEGLRLRLQNRDHDILEIHLPQNYDVADPWYKEGTWEVVLTANGNTVFRGLVYDEKKEVAGGSEKTIVRAYGPWRHFTERTCLYNYPYIGGSNTVSHGILGGSANSLLTNILQLNAADILTIGTINVGDVTIPSTEFYDFTIAQALEAVLRYVSGAIVCFDYSTLKPTIHVLDVPHTNVINYGPLGCSSLTVNPRYDKLINYVNLHWEAPRIQKYGRYAQYQAHQADSNTDTVSNPETAYEAFYYIGNDVAGDSNGYRRFVRTLKGSGEYVETLFQFTGQIYTYRTLRTCFYLPGASGGSTGEPYIQDIGYFMKCFGDSGGDWSLPASGHNYSSTWHLLGTTSRSISPLNSGGGDWYNSFPLMYRGYYYNPPSSWNNYIISPLQDVSLPLRSVPNVFLSGSPFVRASRVSIEWKNIYSHVTGQYYTLRATDVMFLDSRDLSPGAGGAFTFTKTITANTASITTPGIAQKILNANNTLYYDGQFTMSISDWQTLPFMGKFKRVSLTALGVSQTPVQVVSIDCSTDLCTVVFGHANHLGPQDLLSLLRA